MQFNRLSDQILFNVLKNEIEEKLYNYTNAKREDIPKDIDKNVLSFNDLNPIVHSFISTFQKNFSLKETILMLKRLKTLKIEEEIVARSVLQSTISLGYYDNKTNTITLEYYNDQTIPTNIKKTLVHELLHMASTRNTEAGVVTGIEIPNLLGENFNEGVTDYLTAKYFMDGNYKDLDDNRILIVKGIENIVGKELLEECYFDANLGRLINELEKYISRKEVLKLFFLIDRIDDPLAANKNYRSVINEITKINAIRLNRLLREGKISQEEYDVELVIKAIEYKKHRIWTEDTEVIRDGDCFMLRENDDHSEVYVFNKGDNKKQFEKKYQE